MSQSTALEAVPSRQQTQLTLHTMDAMERMAEAFAKSGLFGMKSKDQALALMLVAQAEGAHPATIAQDYDIIKGKASRKTNSVLARFQASGGRVEWHRLEDTGADATFTHPLGGSVRIAWDMERAKRTMVHEDGKKVSLASRPMYADGYPRAMFRARCIAEGVRAVFPAAIGGMLVREEALDPIDPPEKDITAEGETLSRTVTQPQPKPRSSSSTPAPESSSATDEEPEKPKAQTIEGCLTEGMLNTVRARIASANEAVGLTEQRVCEKFEVTKLEEIPRAKVNDVLQFIANPV